MATLLLILIYVAFISLGLPDALLGAGWPVMQPELGVSVGSAGLIQMVISGGTIFSSAMSGRVLRRFGTGKTTAVSVALTAIALYGFSFSPSFIWLLFAAIPLGLGAGSVDAGLNAYVAAHYKSRHMSWLHSFWGVGAMTGPLVLATMLSRGMHWRTGYLGVAGFQSILVLVLISALPLWIAVHKSRNPHGETPVEHEHRSIVSLMNIPGVPFSLITFLVYTGIESTMGLWGGSFLFNVKHMDAPAAASWVSMFYGSITVGRFLTGFVTYRFSNDHLIRTGALIICVGVVLLVAPLSLPFTLTGFLLVGFGCSPIFPCMVHATPERFGLAPSQDIIGLQMAFAYTGSTFLPPAFGFIAGFFSLGLLPWFLVVYMVLLLIGSERLRTIKFRGV